MSFSFKFWTNDDKDNDPDFEIHFDSKYGTVAPYTVQTGDNFLDPFKSWISQCHDWNGIAINPEALSPALVNKAIGTDKFSCPFKCSEVIGDIPEDEEEENSDDEDSYDDDDDDIQYLF